MWLLGFRRWVAVNGRGSFTACGMAHAQPVRNVDIILAPGSCWEPRNWPTVVSLHSHLLLPLRVRPYTDELAPPPRSGALRAAALVPPVLILVGILCHTVLEGLAIGLQVRFLGR